MDNGRGSSKIVGKKTMKKQKEKRRHACKLQKVNFFVLFYFMDQSNLGLSRQTAEVAASVGVNHPTSSSLYKWFTLNLLHYNLSDWPQSYSLSFFFCSVIKLVTETTIFGIGKFPLSCLMKNHWPYIYIHIHIEHGQI